MCAGADHTPQLVSRAEYEQHNREEGGGAWLVVHGNVYEADALSRLADCGGESVMDYVGRDATKAFETAGHSDQAREMAKQFCVGELVSHLLLQCMWCWWQ